MPNWVKLDTGDTNWAITWEVLIEQLKALLFKSVHVAKAVTSIIDGKFIIKYAPVYNDALWVSLNVYEVVIEFWLLALSTNLLLKVAGIVIWIVIPVVNDSIPYPLLPS